jgi:aminoglycoside phosphotransferase (APT) family kinase protein
MDLTTATAVITRFDVPAPVTALEPVGGGHIHETFRVTAGGRRWLLQRVNTRIFVDPRRVAANLAVIGAHVARNCAQPPADLAAEVAQMEFPTPVPARDGAVVVVDDDGATWRMTGWVDGALALATARGPHDCEVAGRAFGTLHRLLDDLVPGRVTEVLPLFHDTLGRLAQLATAAERDAAGRCADCAREVEVLLDYVDLAPRLADQAADDAFPTRVVHNDAKLANVLLRADGRGWRAVIDWDAAGPGLRLHDFGDLVRSLVSPAAEDEPDPRQVVVDPARYQALVGGYLTTAGPRLTAAERASLLLAGQVITLEQAARFLTDHLQGDVYYRTTEPGHNLRRARAQIALLQQLIAREKDLLAS